MLYRLNVKILIIKKISVVKNDSYKEENSKVYDCLTTVLYTWNGYKIILNLNYNWKIKLQKENDVISNPTTVNI